MSELSLYLSDETATVALGAALARLIPQQLIIHLIGDLGAGKTTLTRGLLNQLGHSGAVKSPTYTLVEPYEVNGRTIYHFDLYRLGDPEELEYMGVRDYFGENSISLIEWPQRGEGVLPAPDIIVKVTVEHPGRRAVLTAGSVSGEKTLLDLQQLAKEFAT